jgi:hypothetical protein
MGSEESRSVTERIFLVAILEVAGLVVDGNTLASGILIGVLRKSSLAKYQA